MVRLLLKMIELARAPRSYDICSDLKMRQNFISLKEFSLGVWAFKIFVENEKMSLRSVRRKHNILQRNARHATLANYKKPADAMTDACTIRNPST